ncbi:AraC family transcriptional regulator [Marinobacterium jannaschii]|uniref:AraC family transcriptional regulator n=1 Tax=Marinobacterium jannaschii TaxID=64970 RepID=UPI0004804EE9|nr:AraC family transcriptional regulator [Marinobacterium jannaschii]
MKKARLEKVIASIETCLERPLSVTELAQQVHWSRWQVQRTFLACFGYSLGYYSRCRRLSIAAAALVDTERAILDIAVAAGFETQQSFSRAFSQQFGLSPNRYRLRGQICDLFPRLDPGVALSRDGEFKMEPKIISHQAKQLCGLDTRFNAFGSPDPDAMELLPRLWQQMQAEVKKQNIAATVYWGVVDSSTANDQLQGMTYMAGFEVKPGKSCANLKRFEIPAQTYACYTHQGPLSRIGETIEAIFRDWLPASEYRHTGGPELELYDERFAFEHPDSILEYWVPVEKIAASDR